MGKKHFNAAVFAGDGMGTEIMPEALKILSVIAERHNINLILS